MTIDLLQIVKKIKYFKKEHFWFFYIGLFVINFIIISLITVIYLLYKDLHLNLLFYSYLNYLQIIIPIAIALFGFELFIYGIFGIIKELWYENKKIVIAGVIAWIIINAIMYLTYNTPEEITKNILVYLATIGSLLFVFVPQGLTNINENYILKGIHRQPYNKEKLIKKNISISYVLVYFIGTTITDILITPMFNNRYIKSVKYSLYHDYFSSNNLILKISALAYSTILIVALASLIFAFLEIFTILKYFYFYEKEFDKLNSKYKDWSYTQIEWIIKNMLYDEAIKNNLSIDNFDYFMNKFKELTDKHKKWNKKNIIWAIFNPDKYEKLLNDNENKKKLFKKIKKEAKKMNYEKFCIKENKKMESEIKNLQKRRDEWDNLKKKVNDITNNIIKTCKENEFWENLYLTQDTDCNLIKTTNQNFINIKFGKHPTGISINKSNTIKKSDNYSLVIEDGAQLIISQGPSGQIIFILYPPKSDILKTEKEYFILLYFSDPTKIKNRHIEKSIKNLFWINRIYSYSHSISRIDALHILLWRNWKKFSIWFVLNFIKNISKNIIDIEKLLKEGDRTKKN